MNRRRIFFEVVVSGKPTATCATSLKLDLKADPTIKVIWYANSKAKAEDSMVPSAENKMDQLRMDGEAMALTQLTRFGGGWDNNNNLIGTRKAGNLCR